MKTTPKRQKKTSEIRALVSDEERLYIEAKCSATGMNISELIRHSLRLIRVTTPHDRNIEKERSRQIALIGNNLNQIARWCNTNKSTAETVEVLGELKKIQIALERLHYPQIQKGRELDNAP